jgi:metallo-beta-lactamase class B
VLKDWDVLTLGNIKMTALLGAGHTRGATTWVTTIEDDGRSYNVVFPCCTSVNPLYRLAIVPRIRELPMTSGGHSACSIQ